jgi:hypothetical protein
MISIPRISFACVLRALFCSCVLAVLTAQQSAATIFSLTDDNSVAQFDTSTASNNFNWLVNGNDQLAQLAYWYRIGNGAEQSVHLLPIVAQGTSDTNFNGNPDTLFVRYNNGSGLQIETRYSLDGGAAGTGASDMSAQISITNFTASPMDFHFFQYADFDISSGDSAVFTPVPTHREIAFFPVTLNKLNDGVATTLSDTPAGGTAVGPGDVTWADQWDVVIAPGATFQISTDTNLNAVPEPGVGSLLIVAMVLFSGGRLLQLRTRRATLA